MNFFVVLGLFALPLSLACRPEGYWWGPGDEKDKYFSQGDKWGGWTPPEGDTEWRKWIENWGKHRSTNRPESDEWDSERGPGSGWPQHWRGLGLGLDGVPPPPWAYVPESYEKAHFCFQAPKFGHCSEKLTRWAFNPSRNQCQTFQYSGCGGNQNNFINKRRCEASCVVTAATDCEDQPADLEELIDAQFNPKDKVVKPNPQLGLENTDWDSDEKK